MRILLISDVHGNLPALEAVLKDAKRHAYDLVLSLGDQVNLGPCGAEVLSLLDAHGAVCLRGNHERYVLAAMRNDPAYSGANFASLHYNAKHLTPEALTLPELYSVGEVTFCHAIPGDDRFPVFDTRRVFEELPAHSDLHGTVICGHGHNPTTIVRECLTIHSIGSTGSMDDGLAGMAPYTILDIENGIAVLHPFWTQYDPSVLPALYLSSGMADYCPIMAHICCLQMQRNQVVLLPFVGLARSLSEKKQEKTISRETWAETDALFCWPDRTSSLDYWRERSVQTSLPFRPAL